MQRFTRLGFLRKQLSGNNNRFCEGTFLRCKFFATSYASNKIHSSFANKDGIGVIKLISPGKVNVLNTEVLEEVENILNEIESNPSIKGGVLISNKPDCFIAGADISMLSACKTTEQLENLSKQGQAILNRIEECGKPIVAAIMGSCLGGGLEVAMACHYRVAVREKSTFSMPEVMLGLLPGGGGTIRLPKLIGLPNTLDLILTGKNITPDKAKALGLVDQLIAPLGPGLMEVNKRMLEYLEEKAISLAKDLANGKLKVSRKPKNLVSKIEAKIFQNKYVKGYVFKQAKQKVMKQSRGLYPAPLRILEVVRTGLDKGEAAGYKEEAKGFGELAMTSQSRGLRSLFTGQTACKKNIYGKPKKQINTVAILGAGLMGAGIAHVSLNKGFKTVLKEANLPGLSRGQAQIQKGFDRAVKRKKITQFESDRLMANLIATLDNSHFNKADIVIEAVLEDLMLKQNILKEMEALIPEDCVFATNTSALPISKIAEFSKRPDKVIGMHYFSPVDKMQLLEIITTEKTSKETTRLAVDFGLKQGKLPIVVKDGPGFFTSRVIVAYTSDVYRLMLEGTDPVRVDNLSLDAGFPIGGVALLDEIGLDVGYHIYCFMEDTFGERVRINNGRQLGQDFMNAGILGRKGGKGIYVYKPGQKQVINDGTIEFLNKYTVAPKNASTDENIKLRLISITVNEALLCLQEGIISDPLYGDIASVFGIGFPPFTGGPFHFVDTFGADKLVSKMKEFEDHYGIMYKPCQLLVDYSKTKAKFFP